MGACEGAVEPGLRTHGARERSRAPGAVPQLSFQHAAGALFFLSLGLALGGSLLGLALSLVSALALAYSFLFSEGGLESSAALGTARAAYQSPDAVQAILQHAAGTKRHQSTALSHIPHGLSGAGTYQSRRLDPSIQAAALAQQSQQLLAPPVGAGSSLSTSKPSVRVTVDANSLWAAALAAGGGSADLSALKSVLAAMGGGKGASLQAINNLSASLAVSAGGKRLPAQVAQHSGPTLENIAATTGSVAGHGAGSPAVPTSLGGLAQAGSPGVSVGVGRAATVPSAAPGIAPRASRAQSSPASSSLLVSGGSSTGSLKAPVGLSRCTIVEDAPYPPPNTQVVMELHEKTLRVGGRRLRYRGFRPADRPAVPAPGSPAGPDTGMAGGRGGTAPDQLATRQLPLPPGTPPNLDVSAGSSGEQMQLPASAAATATAALGAMPHYYSFAANNHFHQQQHQQQQCLQQQQQQQLGTSQVCNDVGTNHLATLAAAGGGRVSVSVKVPWTHPAALLQGGAAGEMPTAGGGAMGGGGGGGLLESLNAALASGSGYMVVGAAVRPGCAMLQLDLLLMGCGSGGRDGGGRGRGRRALAAMAPGAHADRAGGDSEDDEEVEPLPLALLYGGDGDGAEVDGAAVAAAMAGALGLRSAAELAAEIARHVGAAVPPAAPFSAASGGGAGEAAQLLVSLGGGQSYVLSLANQADAAEGAHGAWRALPLESAAATAEEARLGYSGANDVPLALSAARDRAAVTELLNRVSAAVASAALRTGRPMPAVAVTPALQLRVLPAAAAVVAGSAPMLLTLLVEVVAPAALGLGARGAASSAAERDAACALLAELLSVPLLAPHRQQLHDEQPNEVPRAQEQHTSLRRRRRATESDSGSDASSACQAAPPMPARRSASDSALDSTLDDSEDWDELPEREPHRHQHHNNGKLPEREQPNAARADAGDASDHGALPRGFYMVANLLGRSLPVRVQYVTPVSPANPATLAAAAVVLAVDGAAAALEACGCALSPLVLELWHGSCQAGGSAQAVVVRAAGSAPAAEAVAAELRALAAAEEPDAMQQVVQDLGSVESYAAVAAAAAGARATAAAAAAGEPELHARAAPACTPPPRAVLLPGSVDLWPELRSSMAASLADPEQRGELGLMAANLLSYAVLRGLPHIAAVVRRALCALGYGLEHADALSAAAAGASELYEDEADVVAGGGVICDGGGGVDDCGQAQEGEGEEVGLPLMHLAALSGNIIVVRQVLAWAAEEGLGPQWVLRRHRGRSPRQAAAEAVAVSAASRGGGVDGGGAGFLSYLAELDALLPKEDGEEVDAAAPPQHQQHPQRHVARAEQPAVVSWLESDSSWRDDEPQPQQPAESADMPAADADTPVTDADDDVGRCPRLSGEVVSNGGAGGRDQKCLRAQRPAGSTSPVRTASASMDGAAEAATPAGTAATGVASPFSHTAAGVGDSYPCSPATPPASSLKSVSNLPAAPLAALSHAAGNAACQPAPPALATYNCLPSVDGAAPGSSAAAAAAAAPGAAAPARPGRGPGRWRRHPLTCCLLGYPDAAAELRYQRFMVPFDAHVASSWAPVMGFLFLAALGRQLRPGGGVDPSEAPAAVLFAGPYVVMAACLAFWPSLVLGTSRGGGSGGANSGASSWRLRSWWLACGLCRLSLKPLLRLGVLAVPPSMVQYSRSGVTLVTDTLLPGLCERMPVSLALPLRLLDAAAHLFFVMQTGIATSLPGGLLHAVLRLGLFFVAAASVDLWHRRRFERHGATAAGAMAAVAQQGAQDAVKVAGNNGAGEGRGARFTSSSTRARRGARVE
ncbi:hypothetical protein HYH02_005974 [Chlamydomonas schloesseri]|uniref:Uncharacterized protein n=1 Tax=Chlamydomonas schloesseri TaxID=2026947 RepID=A0A836B6W9_9CHLO|nr:hypothetical protein HYH02_005974 [Chlamydomonas schloesseri]|eukprot:KAG2449228.1 hypothetical protein HYH02_005974 [Chlamydomonas schloesseri]